MLENNFARMPEPRAERGSLAYLIDSLDWSATPIGPRDVWPTALKTLTSVMLGARQPMFVAWGPERTLIYNDDYVAILGAKHPDALGRDLLEVWSEVRTELEPIVSQAYAGEPVQMDDIAFVLRRNGYPEEAHFAFCYSPIRDEAGAVAGFFCACTEITAQVLADRRADAERDRMRLALQNMPGFVALLAGRDHRYEYANAAYRQIIGERDFLDRPVYEVLPEAASQGFVDLLDRVFRTGEPFVARAMPVQLRNEPSERYLDFIYHAIRDDNGSVTGIFVGGYDVTDGVRASEDLRSERDRLAAVLDGMGEGFALLDHEFRILDINAEGLRLEGRPKNEIVGRNQWEAHPASEHSEIGRALRKAMQERRPVALEHFYAWPGGGGSWLDMRAYPVPDGIAVFFKDVTDRKTAEERARQASARLDLALDAGAITGTWVWDIGADVFVGDERFAKTFGLDPERASAGLPLAEMKGPIHPGDLPGVEQAIDAALTHGGLYRKEYRVRAPHGGYRWIEANGRVELDGSGAAKRFSGVLIDIEERKRMEQERDRASSLLRTFLEAVPGVVYAKDRQGRVLVANRGTAQLIGKPHSEFLGKTDLEFLDDTESARRVMDTDRRIMETGEPELVEEIILLPDGAESIWLSTKAPFRDESGEIVGLIGSSIDVTERKRIEARRLALVELADRLRDLADPNEIAFAAGETVGRALDATRAGYAKVDPTADIVFVDRDWTSAGASSLEGVVRLRDYGTFVRDLRRGETVVIEDTQADPRTAAFTTALEAASVRSLVNVPIIEQGRLAALLFVNSASPRIFRPDEVAFVRDIAERTRAAVERRRAETELRRLAASLEEMVAERTADRDRVWINSRDLLTVIGRDGVIRAANPAWEQVLGFRPEDVVGRSFLAFVPPEDIDTNRRLFDRARAGARLSAVELRCRHRDGTLRHISWDSAREGDVIYGYGRDVTEERRQQEALRQTEDALRQSQKMEAVGQLTGGIAHDFNNMLAVVIGSLDLLKRRIGAHDARTKRYVEAATEGARRAANLTQRLLAFSRQQPLRPEPLDANRLVNGMTDLLRHSLGADIRLETICAGDLWRTYADANQLENVILNLAVNARDAMPDGGRLMIETGNARMETGATARMLGLAPGDYVVIAVSDSGFGMPPEIMARAFDPFFTTKEVGKGTGLGLSQVYGFAKQSGGTVSLQSAPGEGATVRIYLPRHDGELESPIDAIQEPELAKAEGRELVLVVEDEPAVRAFSVDALTELGYRVIEAEGAARGLRLLEQHPDVALLFTDIVMPDVNGRKLADEARSRRPDLKVLYATGYSRSAMLKDGALEPGVDLISKPFTVEELAAKVRETLSS